MHHFNQLQLARELSTKFYQNLGLMIIPAIGSSEPLPFMGCYLSRDHKSISIYGSDMIGLPIDQFYDHLVVYDYLGRPRSFLKKHEQTYEPLIQPNENQVLVMDGGTKLYRMYTTDILPGDQWFESEDELDSGTIISIADGWIHAVNHLSEYVKIQHNDYDHYATFIKAV